jgi:hypothetical protein
VDFPVWWIIFAALSLLAVFGAGIYAIQPRTYSFAPDATDFHQIEQDFHQLQRNRDILTDIDTAVQVETGGILGLTAMAFILAFLIGTG